jgi:hypothetical protein
VKAAIFPLRSHRPQHTVGAYSQHSHHLLPCLTTLSHRVSCCAPALAQIHKSHQPLQHRLAYLPITTGMADVMHWKSSRPRSGVVRVLIQGVAGEDHPSCCPSPTRPTHRLGAVSDRMRAQTEVNALSVSILAKPGETNDLVRCGSVA